MGRSHRAFIRIEGWPTSDHRDLTIGGFLADTKTTRKVDLTTSVDVVGDHVVVTGCIETPIEEVPVAVEVTDEHGRRLYLYAMTDGGGCFVLSKSDEARLSRGRYQV